jgi:hypothetical protein
MKSVLYRYGIMSCVIACLTCLSDANAQVTSNPSPSNKDRAKKGKEDKVSESGVDSLLFFYVKETYLHIQKESEKIKENDQKVIQLEAEAKNLRDTIFNKNNEIKGLKQQLGLRQAEIASSNENIERVKRTAETELAQKTMADWNTLISATLKSAVMLPMDLVQTMKTKGSSDYLFQLTEFGNQSELLSRVTNFIDAGKGSPATFCEDYRQFKSGFNQQFVGQANYYNTLKLRLEHFEAAAKDLDGILSDIKGNKEPKVRKSFLDLYTYSSALDAFPYLKKKYVANYTKDDPLGLTF